MIEVIFFQIFHVQLRTKIFKLSNCFRDKRYALIYVRHSVQQLEVLLNSININLAVNTGRTSLIPIDNFRVSRTWNLIRNQGLV